ncbi:MAG TPA: cupredoxin family copper-binding protein [Rhizomicrobium sp.]|jgi:plastocyanin
MFRSVLRTALAVLVIAAGPAADAKDKQDPDTVVMRNFDFAPMTLTIHAGTAVTWRNMDDEPHTVTSLDGLFRSGALDQDESFSFKFTKPGTYRYVCTIHPRMTGEVVVR